MLECHSNFASDIYCIHPFSTPHTASSNDDVSNLAKDIKNVKLGGASSGAAGGAASNKAPCGLEAPSGNGDLGDPPLPNSG